ncbi:hypothetical protein [Aliarcobacter butzleri]
MLFDLLKVLLSILSSTYLCQCSGICAVSSFNSVALFVLAVIPAT